jgi:hypothetical protein
MNNTEIQHDIRLLYEKIGEGIWMLQHLENVMASFIALKILQQKRETKKNYNFSSTVALG